MTEPTKTEHTTREVVDKLLFDALMCPENKATILANEKDLALLIKGMCQLANDDRAMELLGELRVLQQEVFGLPEKTPVDRGGCFWGGNKVLVESEKKGKS